LKDSELDQSYVAKRDQLKELVASLTRPKLVQGKLLSGKEFVAFLEQVICFLPLLRLVLFVYSWHFIAENWFILYTLY
jgi:hypothetical protein